MLAAISDTHAVIWYLSKNPRLSVAARRMFEDAAQQGYQIGISSISLIEMVYLVEKGRISAGHFSQLANELNNLESLLAEVPVTLLIARALSRLDVSQIPDMPDRIIAATALYLNVPIISRDSKILASNLHTIW